MWNFAELADRIAGIIAAAESDLLLEQAVYGLDFRNERALHELLEGGLGRFDEVAREVHYPSAPAPKRSHRQRCDFVLTPKGKPLNADPLLAGDPSFARPEDALWIEVKVARQFREGGLRHRGYGAVWRTKTGEDLRKMDADPRIRHAGLVLISFNES